MTDDTKQFLDEKRARIHSYAEKEAFRLSGHTFLMASLAESYSYNFSWMGLPVFQYPQDIVALQEIIWKTRPDMIIETGVARGGSLLLYASLLELLGENGIVVGIDIDIREHNRKKIVAHPFSHRIRLVEGSSLDPKAVDAVRRLAEGKKRVMLSLDSNHTHDHVLKELELYTPFVSKGCYCVVFDTIIEVMPPDSFPNRPWGKGDNPMTAVQQFLTMTDDFLVDQEIDNKLIITAAPSGYLLRK